MDTSVPKTLLTRLARARLTNKLYEAWAVACFSSVWEYLAKFCSIPDKEEQATLQVSAIMNGLVHVLRPRDNRPEAKLLIASIECRLVLEQEVLDEDFAKELGRLTLIAKVEDLPDGKLEEAKQAKEFFDSSAARMRKCLAVLPTGQELMDTVTAVCSRLGRESQLLTELKQTHGSLSGLGDHLGGFDGFKVNDDRKILLSKVLGVVAKIQDAASDKFKSDHGEQVLACRQVLQSTLEIVTERLRAEFVPKLEMICELTQDALANKPEATQARVASLMKEWAPPMTNTLRLEEITLKEGRASFSASWDSFVVDSKSVLSAWKDMLCGKEHLAKMISDRDVGLTAALSMSFKETAEHSLFQRSVDFAEPLRQTGIAIGQAVQAALAFAMQRELRDYHEFAASVQACSTDGSLRKELESIEATEEMQQQGHLSFLLNAMPILSKLRLVDAKCADVAQPGKQTVRQELLIACALIKPFVGCCQFTLTEDTTVPKLNSSLLTFALLFAKWEKAKDDEHMGQLLQARQICTS